jgi:phosphatidylserine/phosphatidylglycerophosphate/cardiolipin synthase-like enzyme
MKKLLVPILLAVAYFGASDKEANPVGRWIAAAVSRAAACLEQRQAAGYVSAVPQAQVIEAGFAAADGDALAVKAVNAARERIEAAGIAAAAVTKALAGAKRRGVDVRLVVDERVVRNRAGGAALNLMSAAGIPVRVLPSAGALRASYLIVDRRTVQTGSSEPAGDGGDALIIWNNPDLADAYLKHWRRAYDAAKPFRALQ